jgi:hypothetical protein
MRQYATNGGFIPFDAWREIAAAIQGARLGKRYEIIFADALQNLQPHAVVSKNS